MEKKGMGKERPDLDGLRLYHPGNPNVWLIFHGQKHRIASPGAYDALFANHEGLNSSDEIDTIFEGVEISEGTILARPAGSVSVYLVTGWPETQRYLVGSYETAVDFGFDLSKVIDIPSLVLYAVQPGIELISANDRAAKE
jgi:hypothetical protein